MKRDPEIVNAAFPIPRNVSEGIDWLRSMMDPQPNKTELFARWVQERYEAEVKLLPPDVIEARAANLLREAEVIRSLVEGAADNPGFST